MFSFLLANSQDFQTFHSLYNFYSFSTNKNQNLILMEILKKTGLQDSHLAVIWYTFWFL
jgi:hypothetical protein